MKKNYLCLISRYLLILIEKIPNTMKLTFLFLVISLLTFTAEASAQKVSMFFNNVKVEKVLSAITKQTGLSMAYSKQIVNLDRKVSIQVEDADVALVLDKLVTDTNLSYEIKNNKIYLFEKQAITIATVVQQKKQISGTIVDQNGEPIIGANVVEKGSTNGTITDVDGKFVLEVDNNTLLQVSFIGYIELEVPVKGKSSLQLILQEDTQKLDEVVVVGYGVQKKSTLTGAVSSVKSEQLTIAPVGNVTNTLSGKLPGLITKQTSGMPGSDAASLNIRGFGSPLIIVDGVESSLQNLDVNQIENITILKDGAASIYGSRAGNGVVLVTTKRGINQKPTITVNASYTLQGVTNLAKTASSGQLAQMQRETHLQSGQPEATAPFTAEAVAKFFAGDDPAYPSTDWYNVVFRNWAPQNNENISIRGGSEKIKYYGLFGYQNQETMIKKNGGSYTRYNLQSNIDAVVTNRITLSIDLMAIYDKSKFTGRGIGQGEGIIWQDLYITKPWYPALLPDPNKLAYGGIDVGSVALSSDMDVWGYVLTKNRDIRTTATLIYDVPFVDGLTAKAMINYRDWESYSKNFQKPYQFYTYNQAADLYTLAGGMRSAAQLREDVNFNRQLTQQYSLNYDRAFNQTHHITALALFESIDQSGNNFWASRRDFVTPTIEQLFAGSDTGKDNSGSASEMGRMSVIGRVNYSYKDKYLVEAILRADASAKFAKRNRWGYFPSVSVGWTLSKENFMANISMLDLLKVRAGYGSSGYDYNGNFQYLSGYNIGGLYQWDDDLVSCLIPTGMANTILTWEKMHVYNGGVDFSLWDRILYGSVDGFYRVRDGILATRATSVPGTFGAVTPLENINSSNDRGFELSLGTAKDNGEFKYDINVNLSWARAKWDHYEEAEYADPDQKRQKQLSGQWTDRVFGYVSDGLFTSQEEIDALPYSYVGLGGENKTLRPGDVKYKDMNGDNVLDWKDQVEIGKGNTPHWFYGLTGSFSYLNFDLVAMFQGAAGYSTSVSSNNTAQTYELRWTETDNNSDALVPRLGGAASNLWTSDYWMRSVSYLRLKNLALGYTIPRKILEKVNVERLRVYLSATNLFTLSSLSKYNIDPEVPSGFAAKYYPQQRTISLGVNLSF